MADPGATGAAPAPATGPWPRRAAPGRTGLGPGVRLVLAAYAATLAVTGAWAAAFPTAFYDDFPGWGRVWVAVDGPYNEHLVRDVGTLNLALATLLAAAALRATPALVSVAAGASLVYAVPHFAYHVLNLGVYGMTDKAANVVVLGLAIVAPVAVLWSTWRHGPAAGPPASR